MLYFIGGQIFGPDFAGFKLFFALHEFLRKKV